MIQNLYPLLPRRLSTAEVAAAAAVAIVGAALWLTGARFSRPLLAAAATAGGGVVGFQSPRWFDWTIDPWTVAVLGALVVGVIGYMVHHYLAAIGLAMVVAAWGALATVCALGVGPEWLPATLSSGNPLNFFIKLFVHGPLDRLEHLVITSIALGSLAGLAMSYFWRRLGVVLFWSMFGLTLCVLPALSVGVASNAGYLKWLPNRTVPQLGALFMAVAAGAAIQWKLTFAKKSKHAAKPAANK